MKYGEVALGVECALPLSNWPPERQGLVRRVLARLYAALTRRT
jgi:hypothetical protein